MGVVQQFKLDLNINKNSSPEKIIVTANDNVEILVTLKEGRVNFPLLPEYTYKLVSKPRNKPVTIKDLEVRDGEIVAPLNHSETGYQLPVECIVQVFDDEGNRITSNKFDVVVLSDLTTGSNVSPSGNANFKIVDEEEFNKIINVTEELQVIKENETVFNDKLQSLDLQIIDVVINVKNFGAKGDGVADDTQAIKDAINYASTFNGNNSIRRKSIIYFPNGTYLVSESIVFEWYTIIRGENEKLTIIKAKDNSLLEQILDTRGSMNAGLENIKLDGNRINNGSKNGILLQGTEQYKSISFTINTVSVDNCLETGFLLKSPCFGVYGYKMIAYNCLHYGIKDGSTDNKFVFISAWSCKKAGLYVTGANNHYIGGKHSYNGTSGDLETANIIITNTRNTFSNLDAQDGPSHGVLLLNAYDNIIKGILSDCNGDKSLTDNQYSGFKFINSRNNILDIASTNGFQGLYPNSQYFGIWLDKNSIRNVINYIHSNQVVPVHMENYNNTLNGQHIPTSVKNQYKLDNKGLLLNQILDSKFPDGSSWSGGYRTLTIEGNKGSFVTTGEFARIGKNLTLEKGEVYFLKCTANASDVSKIYLGIEGETNVSTIRPTEINEDIHFYSLVKIMNEHTTAKISGLYINQNGVTGTLTDLICYKLDEDLAKLSLDDLVEVFNYNQMNLQGNNDIGLGNGFKLSQL